MSFVTSAAIWTALLTLPNLLVIYALPIELRLVLWLLLYPMAIRQLTRIPEFTIQNTTLAITVFTVYAITMLLSRIPAVTVILGNSGKKEARASSLLLHICIMFVFVVALYVYSLAFNLYPPS